jgi:uncharacterized protein YbaP (TraB family)
VPRKRVSRTTTALIVGTMLSWASSSSASAEPAMWVARGSAGSAVLYGTDHGVAQSADWDTPKLQAALQRSDELWVESAGGDAQGAAKHTPTSLLLPRGRNLPDLLPDADRRLLSEVEQKLGLRPDIVSRLSPQAAAIFIAQAASARAGTTNGVGVEAVLEERAAARSLPIRGLEQTDSGLQDEVLAPPQDEAIAMLRHALKDYSNIAAKRALTVKRWESADLAGLAQSCEDGMTAKLREDLVTSRNRTFARRIVERLSAPGTIFVAIGTCHLVGPDNLIAILQAANIIVDPQ